MHFGSLGCYLCQKNKQKNPPPKPNNFKATLSNSSLELAGGLQFQQKAEALALNICFVTHSSADQDGILCDVKQFKCSIMILLEWGLCKEGKRCFLQGVQTRHLNQHVSDSKCLWTGLIETWYDACLKDFYLLSRPPARKQISIPVLS